MALSETEFNLDSVNVLQDFILIPLTWDIHVEACLNECASFFCCSSNQSSRSSELILINRDDTNTTTIQMNK